MEMGFGRERGSGEEGLCVCQFQGLQKQSSPRQIRAELCETGAVLRMGLSAQVEAGGEALSELPTEPGGVRSLPSRFSSWI